MMNFPLCYVVIYYVILSLYNQMVETTSGFDTAFQQQHSTITNNNNNQNDIQCGGHLTETHGTLQTPNFPRPFNVPISCRWIIDASNIDAPNPSIVVYLTQLYVFTGLTFHEYAHYESESLKVGGQLIHTVTEQNVTRVLWIRTPAPFMVIEFRLDRLEGNHLRVLDDLLDVYGFNITYEISTFGNPVRANSCNVVSCSYTGNCYVNHDFRSFECACFHGFSGPKCGTGPRCPINEQVCYNGGTCSHLGANDATCQCPPGYTGDRCDIQLPNSTEVGCEVDLETSGINCVSQCPVDEYLSRECSCTHDHQLPSDKVRYEGTIRLANLPAIRTSFPGYSTSSTTTARSLEALIEKQMSKYLKNSNLLKIEDLRILNITSGGEVTFHFFGGKKDSGRVRDAMNRLVERGRLGNFTLASTQLSTKQEPTLLLERVSMNQVPPIRQGDEFSLSCEARGSSYMRFNWYKDGIYVNVTKATRVMKSTVLSPDSDDRTVAILYINKAMGLDNGVYTCQVVDWGIKQCKSLRVEVLLPPQVQIIPMSITIQKGENVSIKCLSPNDRHHEKFGYNWTKNKSLFPLVPGKEVWEDLIPSGSILKIYNAQKSAIYTCMVHSRVDSRSASVRVEVTNRSLVPLCSAERSMNVDWPETAPGVETIQKCPDNLQGRAIRLCTLIDVLSVKWDLPNFSSCHSPDFFEIEDSFRGLTYGFQNTSGVETLSKCVTYLKQRGKLYPGEGQNILRLLNDVFIYINVTLSTNEISEATRTLYEIVDLLLQYPHSITEQQNIINLQQLTRSQALIWGSQMKSPYVEHISLNTLVLDITSLESQTLHNMHIPLPGKSYPPWFEDKIDIRIEKHNLQLFGNNSFTLNIIVFRKIVNFLPIRYVAKRRDGIDLQYEIISRVINIEIGQADNRIIPTQGLFWVDLELVHATDNYTEKGWNVTCGVTDVATFKHTWDLDSCSTRVVNNSVTRCTCTRTGTYAVLWTKHIVTETTNIRKEQPFIVLSGCIICLALSLLTLGILIPYWWHHRTSLIFLKLQCSFSIAGAMAVFIYAVRAPVSKESFIPIATALEIFLLIGMSSHLSKLLIVYTEIVVIPRVGQHLHQTVVCVITGVPILTVLSNHMAYRSLDLQMKTWWLISGEIIFTIFVASAGIMTILFIFIYFSLMRKLHRLIDKHLDKTKAISKRIGLLSRAALIFITIISMETASILYINIHDPIHQYIFSVSCVIVGGTIFFCYIIKCESSLHIHFLRKFRLDKNIEENYSSESVNSPLSFFTKQDGEVETDSAPPSRMRGSAAGHVSTEVTEGLLMSETRSTKSGFYRYSEAPSSTIETYVHSISDNSVEKLYPNDLNMQAQHLLDSQELVNLEHYTPQNSQNYIDLVHIPNSRRNVTYGDYVAEIDVNKKYPSDVRYYYPEGSVDSSLIRPNPGKCYIRDYTIMTPNTEMLTTRVCVELGLVKSPQSNLIGEANISVEAPSNVLCSVDVEPIAERTLPALPCNNSKDTQLELEDSSITESTTNSDINIPKIEIKDMSDSSSGSERRQPEGAVGKKSGENDNLDGMLDRISHDLDYLLNRTEFETVNPVPQTVSSLRKTSKPPPGHSIIGQIREEDEEEEVSNSTMKTEDIDASIAKTVC